MSALLAAQRELARTQQRDANLDLEVQALTQVFVTLYPPCTIFFLLTESRTQYHYARINTRYLYYSNESILCCAGPRERQIFG